MFSGQKIFYSIFIVLVSFTAFSQGNNGSNQNEGGLPKATYSIQGKDSLVPLQYLRGDAENRLVIRIVGGMEHVRYVQTVTSREALIEQSEVDEYVYYITPISEGSCEIMVHITLFEEYLHVKMVKVGDKEKKELVQAYPPKTYLIAYDRFDIR